MWGRVTSTPALDLYLGCNFYTLILGALHLWLQSYLCLTSEHGVQLWILIKLWIHICVVPFEGSTPSLAPVASMFHFRSCLRGQLWILIKLWIHICVVPFEGPLLLWVQFHLCLIFDHVGRSTLELDPAPDLYFGYTFWAEFLWYSYYGNPMLSSKFNILSYNSVPSGQISIILLQTGVIFFCRQSFWVPSNICYAIFKIECFVWLLHSKCSELKKIIYKQGLCFPDNRFGYQQPYVIFKIECFVP